MTAEANKETVRAIYAAMERGDLSAFRDSVHPDYVWRKPALSSWACELKGQEAIQRELIRPLFALFASPYTARAINLVAEGDQVVAEVRGDVATKQGPRYTNHYCFIFRFRDGRIAEVVEYSDTDHEERVLGSYPDAVAAYRAKTPA
ncbi:nuclear transport factor 2 family protein [Phenylobacterium terrae]|uniref:Nuclear transport factor 2 family protein n=1 Tax=Phenylobacterium terrae TaxID=2665495 RepID=A0ABW4MWU7_9CAUL